MPRPTRVGPPACEAGSSSVAITTPFLISSPGADVQERPMGNERTGLLWPWTEADRNRIVEQYASDGRVLCPLDESPLRVIVQKGMVRFRCLRCGNAATQEAPKPPTRAAT